LGESGKAVARKPKGFEMKILYYDIVKQQQTSVEDKLGAKFCSLSGLLAESDFVTIHTNLTTEIHHLIGREELKRMKGSSVLVNIARGPIVDNFALYEALKSGTIAGGALDVTDSEPLSIDHPLLRSKMQSSHLA
jgi:glyoxylate reductase